MNSETPVQTQSRRCPLWVRLLDVLIIAGIVFGIFRGMTSREAGPAPSAFAQAVDLSPLEQVAVQDEGRLKSFDSFTREMMLHITGMKPINGQHHSFTYLDMIFRPREYRMSPSVYVKKKPIREQIARVLTDKDRIQPQVVHAFMETGMIAPVLLTSESVNNLLVDMDRDVIRGSKYVGQIQTARRLSGNAQTLTAALQIVPRPDGSTTEPWYSIIDVTSSGAPQDSAHAGMTQTMSIPGLSEAMNTKLRDTWTQLGSAWAKQDAPAVNKAVADLAAGLHEIHPESYPETTRLKWQSWYFRNNSMTWVWIVYMLTLVPLLMAVIYRWRGAYRLGMGLFFVGFLLQTAALGLRWYISERWPNSNMFEAVTTAAWFGGAGAVLIELCVRKKPLRGLFALASAAASMTALMCAHFMPVGLNSNISNMMPILSDVWLYIHTNVIIFSYCLIFMAGLTGLMYIRYRLGGGTMDVAKAGGAGTLILDSGKAGGFLVSNKVTTGHVLDAATMVLMELSFILLWAGLVMGAIWADHSWGRPWGWDPKEVFALCTFLVFMILVHVRFKVRDKGLWTAWLAVAGSAVMLFNWIVINFKISGLHSYA